MFSVNSIYAQENTCSITGKILDINSTLPLFYVNVGLFNDVDSTEITVTSTDKNGTFNFLNVNAGNYFIKTSYIGYDIYQKSLSVLSENREIILDPILLQPAAIQLPDVTISTSKPVYVDDGEKMLYNVSEDPSVQTGTAADALQNAPGVEVDIEGNVTLNGVSSVQIWINGRPSRLNVENLKTYIQQLPANSLERIEVITNPSARYSAEGTGGIINIVTKSNIKKNNFISFGLNGSTSPMVSPWVSYMFSNEKFSINVYFYGYYSFINSKSNGYQTIFDNNMDTSSYKSYVNNQKQNAINTAGFITAAYRFDSLKTITFWVEGFSHPFSHYDVSQDYKYQEFINNPGIYDYQEKATYDNSSIRGKFGVEYEHKFNNNGHTLVMQIEGGGRKNGTNSQFQRTYNNYSELNKNRKTSNNNKSYNFEGKINYSVPYHKNGIIEAGIEGFYSSETQNRRTDTLFVDSYLLDSMRYENFVGEQGNLDAYITVQHKFGGFTMKGGLRSENRFLNYQVTNQPDCHDKRIYPGLFPSLHLSYATKSMHNFRLSYTRRINYPTNSQLSTFIKYGEDSFSVGNGDLMPTFTNSIEGGWTKYFSKFGSVGLSGYFKNNKDEINSLTDVIYNDYYGRFVSFTQPVNSGKSHQYGANLNVMYRPKSFMNIRLNASVYQYHSETIFRENDEPVMTNCLTYSFRLNFWAKLWKLLEINASGSYRSKTKTIFYESAPAYSINCGLRSDFWNRKISVFLNVQDIFNWMKTQNTNTNPYYSAYHSRKITSRYISAGITFRFGKIELEKQARTGGYTE